MRLVMFSKHLGPLSVPEAGKRVKEIGFSGLDLTVRPGGHLPPEQVEKGLPEAVKQLADLGLSVPMISTGITSAAEPHAEAILATAAAQGIRDLKLGYWKYERFGKLRQQLDEARKAIEGLEGLARKHGVRVCVHIHSGDYLSAEAGNVYQMISGRDPHHIGAYLDPGHMTLEGFEGGWIQGVDLLQNWISMIAVKSFQFIPERNAETRETKWKARIGPLREGTVRWREVFKCLKQLGWDGTVTFHSEYQGAESWRDLSVEELIAQTKDDFAYLTPIIRAAGYSV
jgi:sugar phosphate isomerase/epimerase